MKAIIILLFIGAVFASNLRTEITSDAPDKNSFADFMTGFLEGINVKGDIGKILECVKEGEQVIDKIIKALNFLIHIDYKHMEDIIKGIMMLVEAVQEIYTIITPCINSIEEVRKIFEKIIGTNIMKIVWRLIANSGQFIHDVQDAVASFAKGDFKQAGHDVGDIIYRLFIADALAPQTPAIDFVKGFLEGINEKGDINKILECVNDIEPAIAEIIKAVELITHFTIKDLMEGIKLIVQAVQDIMHAIKPCSDSLEQVKKLVHALTNFKLMEIIGKIMKNPSAFLQDFIDCMNSFNKGDFHQAGHDLGDIFFRLFLEETLEFTPDDAVKLLEGFLDGIGHGQKFIDVEECLKKFPDIYQDILKAIEAIKLIDLRHLDKLVDALMKLFDAFQQILAAIKPCSLAPNELQELIDKIIAAIKDVNKLMNKIIANAIQIFADCTDFIKELQEKKYYEAGKDIGDVLFLVVVKD